MNNLNKKINIFISLKISYDNQRNSHFNYELV